MTGYIKYYHCSICQYGEEFRQGPGFLVKPQTYAQYISGNIKLFHYKIHQKITSLAKNFPGMVISASYQVYKCPYCKIICNKTQVKIVDGDQIAHSNIFKCKYCKRRLKPTNINRLRKAACPGCLRYTFVRQNTPDLLWKK
jgi:hypothetical protein